MNIQNLEYKNSMFILEKTNIKVNSKNDYNDYYNWCK